jgi:hypothetical protein
LAYGTEGKLKKIHEFALKYHIFKGKPWTKINNQAAAADYRRNHGNIARVKKPLFCRF